MLLVRIYQLTTRKQIQRTYHLWRILEGWLLPGAGGAAFLPPTKAETKEWDEMG
jgi:hypothetical protein